MFYLGGSAWASKNWITMGVNLSIDGTVVGDAKISVNETGSHKAFVSNAIVVNNVPAGTHQLTLTPYTSSAAGQQTDSNDFYSLTVVEIVPAA
jgi:hypothetical protein